MVMSLETSSSATNYYLINYYYDYYLFLLFLYILFIALPSVKIWVLEDKWCPKALIFGLGKSVQIYFLLFS